jgi:protein O-GlcNAc transferase
MGLDRSFKEQTATMGDVHHWAWRANGANESVYLKPRDAVLFRHWSKDACSSSEDCVEAQTESDLVVDLAAVRALLEGRMPRVWAGAAVADAELPWPPEA